MAPNVCQSSNIFPILRELGGNTQYKYLESLKTIFLPTLTPTRGTCRWRRSDTFCRFVSDLLAVHRTAADGCAPVRQPLSYTLTVPQSVPLQLPSRNSKALEQDMYRKSAALAQDDQRDAALAVGRLGGGASDGAGPASQLFIACELASPLLRPSHVCTPPAPVRASPTAADATQLTVSSRVCCRCLVPAAHDW